MVNVKKHHFRKAGKRHSIVCLVVCLIILLISEVQAQENNTRAKYEYNAAEEAYNATNFNKTLEHLKKSKEYAGSNNRLIQYLRVKARFQMGRVEHATEEIAIFF